MPSAQPQNPAPSKPGVALRARLPRVAGLFAAVQRRIRLRDALRAVEASVAAGLFLWVAIVLLDWLLGFAPQARLIALSLQLVTVSIVFLVTFGSATAGRIGPLYLAARIESRHPAFANRLIAAVELAATGTEPTGANALIYRQAEAIAAEVDAAAVAEHEKGRAPLHRGLIASLGFLLAAVLLIGQGFLSHSVRIAFPWLDTEAGEPAFLAVTPSGVRLVDEQRLDINALLGGKAPSGVVVELSFSNGEARTVRMQRSLIGLNWTAGIEAVPSSGAFRLRASFSDGRSDLISNSFRILLMRKPRAEDLRVVYRYPKYTKLGVRASVGGSVDALAGTRVTVEFTPSCSLEDAELCVSGAAPLEMTHRPSGTEMVRAWSGSFVLRRSGSYLIRMRTSDGIEASAGEFAMVARQDRKPRCNAVADEIQPPSALANGVKFHLRASDDVGVEEFVLIVKQASSGQSGDSPDKGAGAAHYIPVPGFEPGQREVSAAVAIPPQVLPLEAGVEYSYYVRAADGRKPQAHLVTSSARTFRITDDPRQESLLAKARRKKRRPPLLEPQDDQPKDSLGPNASGGGGSPPPSSRNLASLNEGNRGKQQGSGGKPSEGESSPYASNPGLSSDQKRDQKRDEKGDEKGDEKQTEQEPKRGSGQQGGLGDAKTGDSGEGSSQGSGKQEQPQLPGQGSPQGNSGAPRTASNAPGGGSGGGAGGTGGTGGTGGGRQGTGEDGGSQRDKNQSQDAPDATGRGPEGGGAPNAGKQEKRERDGGMPTGGERGPGTPSPETVDESAVAALDVKRNELEAVSLPNQPPSSGSDSMRLSGDVGRDAGTGAARPAAPMAGEDRVFIAKDDLPPLDILHRQPVARAYRSLVAEYFRRLRELTDER